MTTPVKTLNAITRRDGHVCVMTGADTDRLVPQHRQGGMGGPKSKHAPANVLWLDSLLNGDIESDAELANVARAYGIKVPSGVNPERVPVFYRHEHAWFLLYDDTREQITHLRALDTMFAIYGDDYFAMKARAEGSGWMSAAARRLGGG